MRVLLVSDWGDPPGGVESCALQTRAALLAAGHEASLLACGPRRPVEADRFVSSPQLALLRAVSQLTHPGAFAALARARRELRPDVVHVFPFEHELSPGALRALEGLPLVATVHTLKPTCPTAHRLLPDDSICELAPGSVCVQERCIGSLQRLRDWPRYRMIEGVLGRARVLAPSMSLGARLRDRGLEATVLPHPIAAPNPRFTRAPAPNPLFVSIGRLQHEKGIDLLLRAFAPIAAGHPGARLRIVGDGPAGESLRRLARELGIDEAVEFSGRVADAPDRALADAWALVAPSRCEETFGLVAAEAVIRGVPVVASAQGGLAETVVEGLSGTLVPNGELAPLADALRALAGSGPRAVPEEESQRVRARHSVETHAELLGDIYRLAADRTTPAPAGALA